jgi:hypothetical protein
MITDIQTCIGLDVHKTSPDLAMLPQFVSNIQWVSAPDAISAAPVLVVPGIWLADTPGQAADLLRGRVSAGRNTIVVPRFRAGSLASILGAPSAVEIAAAEFKSFEWGDHHYQVPGFTVIKTALHAGKWGEAPGVGTVLLTYRPHTVSGAIVLCAATVTSRLVGVAADTQKALLLSMIVAATTPAAEIAESIEAIPLAQPASIDEFLEQERELGAAFLLSRLAVADPDLANITEVASEHLNILLSAEDVSRLRQRLPRAANADIRIALSRFGWGAYLRRLHPPSELTSEVRTK